MTKWIDQRGFGFLEIDQDHREVFLHISVVRQCLGVERLDAGTRGIFRASDELDRVHAQPLIVAARAGVERDRRKIDRIFVAPVTIDCVGVGPNGSPADSRRRNSRW